MKILSIETSCDETSIAIVECLHKKNVLHTHILAHSLHSQIQTHAQYGGVFPAVAKREHAEYIIPLLEHTLAHANMINSESSTISPELKLSLSEILSREPVAYEKLISLLSRIKRPNDIDLIAVTNGPGLPPALWVGVNVAKAISLAWGIPVIGTNHMKGHVVSILTKNNGEVSVDFPALALLISGGHTELVLLKDWAHTQKIGSTRDDAVGEAFDKVARMLGLPYPGGPQISKLAREHREKFLAVSDVKFPLPRPMIHSTDLDFSFSGLKTAVLYTLKNNGGQLSLDDTMEIAREFEDAVIDVLTHKTKKAIETHNVKTLIVGGGVIANEAIRNALSTLANSQGIVCHVPEKELATDNAVMIGVAGYMEYMSRGADTIEGLVVNSNASL